MLQLLELTLNVITNSLNPSACLISREESLKQFVMSFRPIKKHARFLRRFRGLRIAINGVIGAGKSTLVSILKEVAEHYELPISMFLERIPMDKLQDFINYQHLIDNKPAHIQKTMRNIHAFPLQMNILEYRLEDSFQALKDCRDKLVIFDRNLYGDFVFTRANYEMGNFTETEWLQYMERYRQVDIVEVDINIQLDVNMDTSAERIKRRSRTSEDKYDPKYIKLIHDINNEVANALTCPVLRLIWNQHNNIEDPAERERIGLSVFKAIDALLMKDIEDDFGHMQIII